VMITVGIELPLWRDKYKTRARGAERMEQSALANREAIERQVAAELLDTFSRLQAARQTLELYRKSLIPQAEASFKAAEAAYRTGKGGFLDLLESKRFLLNARLMCAMAESNAGIQFARLERAVGADMKSPVKKEVKNAK
jgi:outer membrane protein, heavy metal efflux system